MKSSRSRRLVHPVHALTIVTLIVIVAGAQPALARSGPSVPRSTVVVDQAHGRKAHIMLTRAAMAHIRGVSANKASLPADTTSNMTWHGGPVMRNSVNYLIFWQPTGNANTFPAGYQAGIQRYFEDVGGTPFYNIVTQYGDGNGPVPNATSYGDSWMDTNAFPHAGTIADPLTDGDIQTAVSDAITANPAWQAAGLSTMYFVFLPPNTDQCFSSSSCFALPGETNGEYCAYHTFYSGNRIYAVMPFAQSAGGSCTTQATFPNGQAIDEELSPTQHEQIEANTDPLLNAWYDPDGLSGEIGDKCAYNYGYVAPDGTNIVLNGNRYNMQREWSNNPVRGCVKRYGPAPVTSVTGSLDFGTVPRGTSNTLNAVIQNQGGADLNVLNMRLSGASSSAYSLVNVPPTSATIPGGASLTVKVKFAPSGSSSSPATLTGTLIVDTDDPAQTTYNTSLTGVVGVQRATLSASSLNLGGVAVDDRTSPNSSSATIAVANTGTADLALNSIGATGDFSASSPVSLPATIAPGAHITLTVSFNPSAPGSRTGTLSVNTDDPNDPTLTASLSGTGLIPALSFAPASLRFAPTVVTTQVPGSTGSSKDLGVTNTGQAELIVDSQAVTPDPPFSIAAAAVPPDRYAANAGYTTPVNFAPTAVGRFTGTVTVSDTGAGVGPVTGSVAVCGEGVFRGIRVLVVNGNGVPYANVAKLRLTSHNTSPGVNINVSNLPLQSVTTSCVSGQQRQYENQSLPAAPGGTGNHSAYYTLSVSVGGKSATRDFTLQADEFKEFVVTVK